MTLIKLFISYTGVTEIWVRPRCAPMITAVLGSKLFVISWPTLSDEAILFWDSETSFVLLFLLAAVAIQYDLP